MSKHGWLLSENHGAKIAFAVRAVRDKFSILLLAFSRLFFQQLSTETSKLVKLVPLHMPGFTGKRPSVDANLVEHYAEEMGRGARALILLLSQCPFLGFPSISDTLRPLLSRLPGMSGPSGQSLKPWLDRAGA